MREVDEAERTYEREHDMYGSDDIGDDDNYIDDYSDYDYDYDAAVDKAGDVMFDRMKDKVSECIRNRAMNHGGLLAGMALFCPPAAIVGLVATAMSAKGVYDDASDLYSIYDAGKKKKR